MTYNYSTSAVALNSANTSLQADNSISEDLLSSFISYLDTSEKTIATYKRALKQFFIYLTCEGISHPTRETIVSYRNYLQETHQPTTTQSYLIAVKQFFKWTAYKGIYPNISDHVKTVKLNRNFKKDYLTSYQVKKVLEHLKEDSSLTGLRNYAIMLLMFTGALRTIEVSRANIDDLRTAGSHTVLYVQGKGRSDKTEYVKLAHGIEDAVRDYLKALEDLEPVKDTSGKPLFVSTSNNSKGKRLTTRTVSNIAKESFKAVGLNSDRLTAHSTRHTAITLALIEGQDLQQVRQFARHANINTTLIYAHNLERADNDTEEVIASCIL